MDAIHVQAPDGSVIQFPAGTPDATINSVMASEYGNRKAPEEKGTLQTIREAVQAPTRILENGLFMGLGDRARAGMDAIIGKGDYGSNLKNEQAQTGQFEADHPISSTAIGGIGGIAAPIGMLGAASKATGLAGKVGYGAAAGAGIGGVQGGLSSHDWTDLGQTAKDTAIGAGVGGLLGGSLPLAGKAIGAGYNALADALTKPEGMSRGASRHLIEALNADSPQAVRGQVDRLGPDAMLADTAPPCWVRRKALRSIATKGVPCWRMRYHRATRARTPASCQTQIGRSGRLKILRRWRTQLVRVGLR
jgi:hypothetical protein